jgi:hypothetical protein
MKNLNPSNRLVMRARLAQLSPQQRLRYARNTLTLAGSVMDAADVMLDELHPVDSRIKRRVRHRPTR